MYVFSLCRRLPWWWWTYWMSMTTLQCLMLYPTEALWWRTLLWGLLYNWYVHVRVCMHGVGHVLTRAEPFVSALWSDQTVFNYIRIPPSTCTYTCRSTLYVLRAWATCTCCTSYRITRMFCEYQTFANFARVDQFATIKSAKPKLLRKYTDPCQNAIV